MSKYTKDQIDRARKMYTDGHTCVTISSETGIPFSSVRYHVRDLVGSRSRGGRAARSIDLHAIAPAEKQQSCEKEIKLRGFIEIVCGIQKRKRLLNVRHIEEVVESADKCCIYMAYDCPDALEQDYYEPEESYEEIKQKIQEA